MSIIGVKLNAPGRTVLLTGNEAVARGAMEAGVSYASSYPGSPSSEIVFTLGQVAKAHGFYAEWSTNEKVAVEGAAGASFAGLRSMCVMKADGMNVAMDPITALSESGTKGGMVIVVSDDPAGHSSVKEEDSRYLDKVAHLAILEPANAQEAKDMMLAAFDLSEQIKSPVVLRLVTRVCHASGNVTLGEIPRPEHRPAIGPNDRFVTNIMFHVVQEQKLTRLRALAETWPFTRYLGPEDAETVIVTTGPGFMYSQEAVEMLDLEDRVGILKLGMSWPLPEQLVVKHLKHARKVLFVEEVEPFHEENVMYLAAHYLSEVYPVAFYGKKSGHVAGPQGPGIGEMDTDVVVKALAAITDTPYALRSADYGKDAGALVKNLPERELAFCAGCPHRASFWAIKSAIAMDGRHGIVLGDIGCYTMGLARTGYYLLQTMHAMGSGVGIASGLGKLKQFGFNQPVVAMVGDSTFYHAVMPALTNARYNQSNFLLVVLDNETTAMTGHQPHPGRGVNALGETVTTVTIEELAGGLGLPVTVHDPYDVESTTAVVYRLLQQEGTKVLVLRRACVLVATKGQKKPRVYVDQEKCIGDACGCNRFCSRVFGCPGNIWDAVKGKAAVDEAVCNGCGVCVTNCPQGAIIKEEVI